jgi:hypothetical protein
MENNNEIIINENLVKPARGELIHTLDQRAQKVKKPLSEEQREKQRLNMRNYYLARKNDPDYIERQRLSSKTHYYKHKQEVLERMKRYQLNKLELAQIEMLHEIQQERSIDLMTGDISQEDYDKLQQKINDKLAHLHLLS